MISDRVRTVSRRVILGVTAVLLFLAVAVGPMTQVAEAACASPSIAFGRWRWCGYWLNRFDDSGDSVRIGGVPSAVNTPDEFITMIFNDLASGNANRVTGASFVIQTMIGSPLPNPSQGYSSPTTPRPPTTAQRNDWASRVRSYGNLSQVGNTSYGSNGRIDWFARQHIPCGTYNTYWQGNGGGTNPNDVAPYVMNAANSDCNVPSVMDDVIIFRDQNGVELYKIRRNCMNPLGTLREISDQPVENFRLDPGVGMTIRDNGTVVPGTVAEVGDEVTFSYTVYNHGLTPSSTANCSVTGRTYSGYQDVPSAGPLGGTVVAGVATGCPRTFNVGNTNIGTEVITLNASHANQTLCRQVEVSPETQTNSAAAREVSCVKVANKPYSRVFNGDVAAGSGFATASAPGTCTQTNHASVLGWNRRSASSYNGAGTRHAVYALEAIFDYATAQNSSGAATPKGLSFANTTTNITSGWFGGNFGSAPCIPDYFGQRPAATQSWTNSVGSMTDGVYHSGTSAVLGGGTINTGNRISVYVDGDLHITGNITYANSFDLNNMPLFQVVVRGNIYIQNTVTRLDGIYVAQPTGSTKGIIYTCATSTPYSIPSPTAGGFYSACNSRLTVNGAFTARQIALMRTAGSLKSSSAGESVTSNNAGEAFNYGPAFWLQQPRGGTGNSTYDSITSLPPIL